MGNWVYRYFTKPCKDTDLAVAIRKALELKDLREENRQLLDAKGRPGATLDSR